MNSLWTSTTVLASLLTGSLVAQNQTANFVIGTDSQYIVADDPALVPTNGITVEAWVTYDDSTIPTGVGPQFPSICRHTLDAANPSYIFRVEAGDTSETVLRFLVNSAGFGIGAAQATFAPGELAVPTHVAGTFDGQNYAVYINGVLRASAAFSGIGTIVDGGGDLAIGNGGDGTFTTETTWNGEIDEFRIWPFARTEAEIMETMNASLFGVPGGVTFNIDNAGIIADTSQGLIGTPTASVTVNAGQPLPPVGVGAQNAGTPTTGCIQELATSVGSSSRAGNTGFEIVCYDGTPNVPGGLLIAFGTLPGPLPFLGIDLFVDPASLLPVVPPVTTDATGQARFNLPLGAGSPVGVSFTSQFLFIDACGAMGLTSSEAIITTIQ